MTQVTHTYDDSEWQLVPKKMTDRMDAALSFDRYNSLPRAQDLCDRTLAAAPQPPEAPPAAVSPVVTVHGADEYGPILNWHSHWVNHIGAKLGVINTVPDGAGDAP